MVQEAARAQARGPAPRLRARATSSAAWARRSRSSAASASSRAPGSCTSRAQGLMSRRGSGRAAAERPLAKEALWHFAQPRRALDLRARPAALRPARRQPGVLRRPRLVGLRHHLLLGPAGACCRRSVLLRDRAAGRPGRPSALARACTWCSSALLVALIAAAGAEEVDRRLGRRADRAARVAIGVARGARSTARAEPLRSFLNVLIAGAARVPGAVPVRLAGVEARLPGRGRRAHRRRRRRRRRSWWCCSTSCRPTRWWTSTSGSTRRAIPGFAELARNATWFKNAPPIYDSTERAQPAIMDGDLPAKDRLPISADHPNSIFIAVRQDATG